MPPSSRRTRLIALALVVLFIVGFALRQRNIDSAREPLAHPAAAQNASRPAVAAQSAALVAPSALVTRTPAPALFRYVEPANVAELDAALWAPTKKIHYVKLDEALIDSKQSPFWQDPDQGRLALPLPDGGTLTVAIHSSEMLGAKRFTSTGTIEGHPGSQAIFAYNEGFLHAMLEDPATGLTYELRAATDGSLEQFYEVDSSQVAACGGARHPTLDSDALAEVARRMGKSSLSRAEADALAGNGSVEAPPTAAYSSGSGVVVHLMMLYTQGVRGTQSEPQRTAAIQSDFDAVTALVNSDFANSLISARVKLVKISQVNYPGDELNSTAVNWQDNMLDALRKTTDGTMDDIHALRDQVGADLVCLVEHRFDTSSSGLGYVLQFPNRLTNPLFGFSVVLDAAFSLHVVSHELGHNFGCEHNREDSTDDSGALLYGAYPYSFGYRFTTSTGAHYRDIMSYDLSTTTTTYVRLPYFSNPDVIPKNSFGTSLGVPIGVTPGAAGEADNALTIDQSAFEVADFRLQTQTTANAGTLVNVSTRAFVGTGEQQMIGGFIIAGTAPKKMLIRASGPALIPYGVSGTLPDPKISLIPAGSTTPVAVNATGWETQTGTSSGVTANDIVNAVPGAFAVAHGSKDAALLVTLQPGGYTANIESVSNTTGAALIEAYEVDRNNNKLFNLSTRAYASKASPIFAGFVVQGDPGTTKRILIRAQGPSLAKFGISAPLSDPVLELYNSDSTLIMKNDDWVVNVSSTGGTPDDTKPIAIYYSEVQIAATGFNPLNRREPCIMVDLAPGLYSAVIRPFESSSQPATPGVAIVEVFEINQ